jgi:hypothetical protein
VKGEFNRVSGCVVGGEGERITKTDAARVSGCVVGGVMGRTLMLVCGFGTCPISGWSVCIGSAVDKSSSGKLPGMSPLF